MQDKIAGCLFGAALGDAFGAPTEFIRSAAEIEAQFGKGGPSFPLGFFGRAGQPLPKSIRVTDDTQMMLVLYGRALAI